jgi:conjugal transfer pilus assembly protein TraF
MKIGILNMLRNLPWPGKGPKRHSKVRQTLRASTLPPPNGGPLTRLVPGGDKSAPALVQSSKSWCRNIPDQTNRCGSPRQFHMQTRLTQVAATLSATLFVLLISLTPGQADTEPFRLNLCADRTTQGWSFYCREPEPPVEEEEMIEPVIAAPPAPAPEPMEPDLPATEEMMAFRAYIDEIKYRAVLDPTEDNVRAYIQAQQAMIDQAGTFTDQWQRIIFSSPELSVLDDYPMAAAGISVYQDQMREARENTFLQVANEAGILFIFNDSAVCGLCRVQGEVLAQMEAFYGVTILAVSKDGGPNEHFPDAVNDDGRLADLGLQDYPAPTLALVNPNTGEIAVIGTGLITAEEVLERVFVIVEIPVGERY